jgi:DNA-binding SARP family transcriptional activator
MEGIPAEEERAARLRLSLLGAAEAALDGRRIVFRTKKALALLAYLAVDPGPHPRERLADLLWPQSDVVDARASLRTALNYMRQALGLSADAVITATRESLGLRPGAPVDIDVQALAHAQHRARCSQGDIRRHQIEAAVDRIRGPFLAGMLVPDAPEFEAWIESQRTYWSGVESELLDRLATRQLVERGPAAAISTLERWTSLNPDEEPAWQRLIEAHLRTQDVAGARRAWSAYRRAMAELDAEPSHQMATLHDQILGQRHAKHRSGPAATVTLGGGAGSRKARLVSQFLKSIGSTEPDVAELERWLTVPRPDSATLRLELKTTVEDEHSIVVPAMAVAI